MAIAYEIKKDTYYDSVTLMLTSSDVEQIDGVREAVVGMGTDYNIDSLKRLDLYQKEFDELTPHDLIFCVEAEEQATAETAIEEAEKLLTEKKSSGGGQSDYTPPTQSSATEILPEANMVLISVPGEYAAKEAHEALDNDRHVMLFSDNVSLEEELELKEKAVEKNLLMMGPDCGTAIINNKPLAFSNVVRSGNIGVVAASGTGLQETTSIIHRLGFGISQGIGVGGRDLSEKIEGRMTLAGARALDEDDATDVILLISKPPAKSILDDLLDELKKLDKPTAIFFIGADAETIK
ncbi:MAG: acyl-CoA synthetase FdrA, partial [bacterium]